MESYEVLSSDYTKFECVDLSPKKVKNEIFRLCDVHNVSDPSADVESGSETPKEVKEESSGDLLCDINTLLKCELNSNEEKCGSPLHITCNFPDFFMESSASISVLDGLGPNENRAKPIIKDDVSITSSDNSKKSSKASKKSTCTSCGRSFKKMIQHRCKAGLEYPCDICGKFFAHTSSLNAHKRLHTGVKYTCEMCGKSLTTKNSYISHQQRHLAIKPFVCDFCNKGFVKKHYLMEHRRVHLGIRPYICQTCGKSFTRNTHLAMHMGAHKLQFKCEVCKKCFTRNGQLKEHRRVHTGEKPFECEVCKKCYTRKSHLVNHKCMPISDVVTKQLVDDPFDEECSDTSVEEEFANIGKEPLIMVQ